MNTQNAREGWAHGSALSEATATLHQTLETARQAAHQVLQLPDSAAPGESPTLEAARASAQRFLQHQAPRATRAVADLLGFSNLWRTTTGRMRRLAATPTPEARRELTQGVRLLLRSARTRLEALSPLAGELVGVLGRLEALGHSRGERPGVLTSCLRALATALADVVAASQALHHAWETLVMALDAAAARLDSTEVDASSWLAERLEGADFGWNRAHATAQRLQTEAPPAV